MHRLMSFAGKLLQRRLVVAKNDAKKYAELFNDFKQDLQEVNVKEWLQEVTDWEKNTTLKDPYDIISLGASFLLDS